MPRDQKNWDSPLQSATATLAKLSHSVNYNRSNSQSITVYIFFLFNLKKYYTIKLTFPLFREQKHYEQTIIVYRAHRNLNSTVNSIYPIQTIKVSPAQEFSWLL